jgi:hypothetical protein
MMNHVPSDSRRKMQTTVRIPLASLASFEIDDSEQNRGRNLEGDRVTKQTNQIATTQIFRLQCRQTAEKSEKQPMKPKALAGWRMFDEFSDLMTDRFPSN